MTNLLLSEEVFLLGHDDESGKNEVALGLTGALAGALLLDLALSGLIQIEGKNTVVASDGQPGHPLLARAHEAIIQEKKQRSVRAWLNYLPSRLKPLDQAVGHGLVERRILSEQKAKVLGLFSTTRWPELDPMPEQRLRARLVDVLLQRSSPSDDDIALVALLQSYNLVRGLVDKPDRKQASKTAEDLRKRAERGDVVSKAIGQTVRATQAAVLSTIVASNAAVAASTAATTT